jgi:hypothetical protein
MVRWSAVVCGHEEGVRPPQRLVQHAVRAPAEQERLPHRHRAATGALLPFAEIEADMERGLRIH